MRIAVMLMVLLAVSPVWADGTSAKAKTEGGMADWSAPKAILFFEGIAAFNSAAAAANPRIAGGIILVTAPLAFAEDRSPLKQSIVAVSGYAAIGVYDTTHYPAVYSRPRVFTENFLAWNLWAGSLQLMARGDQDGTAAKLARHVSVLPQDHGGFRVDCHWTF